MLGYTLPLYQPQLHTATKAAVISGACVIYAVQIRANGGNVDVQLIDALTDTGTDDLDYSVLDGDTLLFDYSGLGGVGFGTGLSLTTTSNAAIVVWADKNQATG